MARILGINGSPRKGGNSEVMLAHFLKGASKSGLDTEAVHLRDYYFQSCIGCEKCRKDKTCTSINDGMQLIYPKVIEATGLILVSPTHNYNVTAWMKSFIDRLYCYYDFTDERPRGWSSRLAGQGRKAVIACIGEQPVQDEATGLALTAMRLPIEALGYEVLAELPVIGIFDKAKVKERSDVLEEAEKLGRVLADQLG